MLLGRRLKKQFEALGSYTLDLQLAEDSNANCILGISGVKFVLTEEKGFTIKNMANIPFEGNQPSRVPYIQERPEIRVYRIIYTKPKGIFSFLSSKK